MTAQVLASNYVGNANSKKFHYADCSAVTKMNPSNRVEFNSRDEAINAGYIPCKKCSP
ncbi:MAG: nuclease [Selenomonadaceae bacterium]|nr:nuclease [Selenomonadaceae bacterium]